MSHENLLFAFVVSIQPIFWAVFILVCALLVFAYFELEDFPFSIPVLVASIIIGALVYMQKDTFNWKNQLESSVSYPDVKETQIVNHNPNASPDQAIDDWGQIKSENLSQQ